MNKGIAFSVLLMFCICLQSVKLCAKELNFIALNMKGNEATAEQWQPLANYLAHELQHKVIFGSLQNAAFIHRSAGKDILLTNPVIATKLENLGEFEIVATLNHIEQGAYFAGVIIVPHDSPISTLDDLADKTIGVVNVDVAAGGFLFQVNELIEQTTIPIPHFPRFEEMFNQKAIVQRVIEKKLDAGFIRTGMLEQLEGVRYVSKLRILNRMDDGLAFPRSTAIYPHWALLVNKKLSSELKDDVINSVFAIAPDSEVAIKGRMKGFVPAADYSELTLAIEKAEMVKQAVAESR